MSRLVEGAERAARVGLRRLALRAQGVPCVAYAGGHGVANLGDDAMGAAARALLAPASLETIHAGRLEPGLRRVGLSGPRYFRGFVLGGGTFLNPAGAHLARAALALGLPAWTLGTGAGSWGFSMEREVDLREWAPLLRDFAAVGVRGPRSAALLEAVGVARVQQVGDLALALTLDAAVTPADPPRFLVNVNEALREQAHGYAAGAAGQLEDAVRALTRAGATPVFVAMHHHDLGALRALMAATGHADAPLHRPTTAEAFFALAAPCTFSLVVRLHAGVLSTCAGVPPLMLGYREKCLDFMESLGLEAWYVSLEQGGVDLRERALALAAASLDLRPVVLARAQALRARLLDYVAGLRRGLGLP